jgi:methionine-rich copper-binding protein CopC
MKGERWVIFIICLLVLFPVKIGAHSYVVESFPNDGQELAKGVDEIVLHFNAGIEGVSTVTVYDESGQEVETEQVKGESSTLTVTLGAPLTPGTYQVKWKALGEDTHHTEGSFLFTILEYENEEIEEEWDLSNSLEDVELEENRIGKEDKTLLEEEEDSVQLTTGRFLLPVLITAIVIIIFISFLSKRRRL